MQTRPANETRPQRIERYRTGIDQWRQRQAATADSSEYDAKRLVRHGWVWLYERVAVEKDTP